MNGLELSRAFFEEWGRPMLEREFPALLPYLAAGLMGSGSECFGYDDQVSRDHDFEPGFCLFLPGEETVDRRSAFLLERAYAKLPREFRGVRRPVLLPVGGARRGVLRLGDFFEEKTGSRDGTLSLEQWLTVPEASLAEAVNGELYFDNYGELTRIRVELRHYPEDIRRKRLAGQLLLMAQAGQYNYPRCLRHGETGAAALAAAEYVRSSLSALFLLGRRYQPYYKWAFRALRELPGMGAEAEALERILSTGNSQAEAKEKTALIGSVCRCVLERLAAEGLSDASGDELEAHAYAVNDRIGDPVLRTMHILAAV
ncbi:MAG: DUF4037 domain-containing protein [Oscillospiraceae bacterium]|nr:DUF4037 domain-containing protein [Oscillospiraceae bacterium]